MLFSFYPLGVRYFCDFFFLLFDLEWEFLLSYGDFMLLY